MRENRPSTDLQLKAQEEISWKAFQLIKEAHVRFFEWKVFLSFQEYKYYPEKF